MTKRGNQTSSPQYTSSTRDNHALETEINQKIKQEAEFTKNQIETFFSKLKENREEYKEKFNGLSDASEMAKEQFKEIEKYLPEEKRKKKENDKINNC